MQTRKEKTSSDRRPGGRSSRTELSWSGTGLEEKWEKDYSVGVLELEPEEVGDPVGTSAFGTWTEGLWTGGLPHRTFAGKDSLSRVPVTEELGH